MSTVDLSSLGISAEAQEKAPEQKISSGVWESQVAKMVIKEAASFETVSGATMFKVTLANEEEKEYTEYFNTKYKAKKDDPKGKYKTGEMVENMGGVSMVNGLVAASGVSDIGPKPGTFKAFSEDQQNGVVVTGLINKVVLVGIREIEDPNSEYPQSNEIAIITDLDGKNSKGEEVMTKFKELIEKTPVLKRKLKSGGSNNSNKTDEQKKAEAAAATNAF